MEPDGSESALIWTTYGATGERQVGSGTWLSSSVGILDEGSDYRLAFNTPSWQFFSFLQVSYNFTTDPTPVYLGQHGTDVASFVTGEPDGLWGLVLRRERTYARTRCSPAHLRIPTGALWFWG